MTEFVCKPHEPFPCSNPQGCGGAFCKAVKQENASYIQHCKNVLETNGYVVRERPNKYLTLLAVLKPRE